MPKIVSTGQVQIGKREAVDGVGLLCRKGQIGKKGIMEVLGWWNDEDR